VTVKKKEVRISPREEVSGGKKKDNFVVQSKKTGGTSVNPGRTGI